MKSFRWGDILILLISLVLTVASFSVYRNISGKPIVHVRSGPQERLYDLSVDRIVEVEGLLGPTTIEIKDGKVRVTDSACRNKICIAAGWQESPGEWIICLPNNIFIMIEGSHDLQGEIDELAF